MGVKSKVAKVKRFAGSVMKNGLSKTLDRRDYEKRKNINPFTEIGYEQWKKQHKLSGNDIKRQKEYVNDNIIFYVLIDNTVCEDKALEATKNSIRRQTFKPRHVAVGSNETLEKRTLGYAQEDAAEYWILKLKGGDVITPDFLYECAQAIEGNPEVDIWYTDHEYDKKVYLKPDFNTEYLCAYNYIGEAFVARNRSVNTISMSADEYLLGELAAGKNIAHIAKDLFEAGSDVDTDACMSDMLVKDIQKINNKSGKYHIGSIQVIQQNGIRRVLTTWDEKPTVSVIIPNKDHIDDLKACLAALQKQDIYNSLEILIVENNSTEKETFEYYDLINGTAGIKVLYWKEGFNYSAINNFAAKEAKGDFLLLLNNDVELIGDDCISTLLATCMYDETGMVGTKLLYSDDTVQHAGVVVGYQGVGGHSFVGINKDDKGFLNMASAPRRVSAVTAACLMIKKSVYDAVNGFDERYAVAFNDVDLCMKVVKSGMNIVYQPFACGYHFESKTRGNDTTEEEVARFGQEVTTFLNTWGEELAKGDPFYNVNKSLNTMKADRFRDIYA